MRHLFLAFSRSQSLRSSITLAVFNLSGNVELIIDVSKEAIDGKQSMIARTRN